MKAGSDPDLIKVVGIADETRFVVSSRTGGQNVPLSLLADPK